MTKAVPPYSFERQTQIVNSGYGANNIAVEPNYQFPMFNFFGWGGILPKFHWSMLQGPQLWVNPALVVSGNPGIEVGQLRGQPQLDTRGINGV